MPTSMPVACKVYYKLRTERIGEKRLGDTLSGEDYNALLEGKQNIGKFAVDFDPANELYDLFYMPLNENGEGPEVKFNNTLVRATLDEALNSLKTLFKVTITNLAYVGAIRAESPIQIGNEILVVSKVTSAGGSTTLEVETRGDHGSPIEDHAKGAEVILLRYSVPHNTIKLDGILDSSLPLRAVKFLLDNTVGPSGNGIEVDIQLPDNQIKTLKGIQLQLSTKLWLEDISNVTGLKGIQAQGADGKITQGGTSLTTQSSLLSSYVGKSLYTYEGMNLATGEITYGRCVVIDNVTDNGDGTWTANIAGDLVFRLRSGKEGATGTVNWIVADGWLTPGNTPTWVADKFIAVASTGFPGEPVALNTHRTTIITGASVYARCRLANWQGAGPWVYWDGVHGSADRADAVLFVPGADMVVPSAVTVVAESIGLNVFLNMAPIVNIEGYNYFRFYRIKIYLNAARTKELLNITTAEHTRRGGDTGVSFNFQVPTAGQYWYEVIPVNVVGDGAATLGPFTVTGLAATLADGVPGTPSVSLIGGLQGDTSAAFRLARPTVGFEQIGLYTVVVRTNNDFRYVYNASNILVSLIQNSDILTASSNVFSAASVGKLIELTGIESGNIPGQTDHTIVDALIDARHIKMHRPWLRPSQQNKQAKIGDPWWNRAELVWHQLFYVVGEERVATQQDLTFDFVVPISGTGLFVSASALSIFGSSDFAAPANFTTSDPITDTTIKGAVEDAVKGIADIKGTKGSKGSKGFPGGQGNPGVKGSKGDLGLKGFPGGQGNPGGKGGKGSKGSKGFPGGGGNPGVKGSKGDLGLKGFPGGGGNPGVKGTKGDLGLKGFPGTQGDPGGKGLGGDQVFVYYTNAPQDYSLTDLAPVTLLANGRWTQVGDTYFWYPNALDVPN